MTIKAKKRNGVRSRKRTARTRKVLTGGSNYGKLINNGGGKNIPIGPMMKPMNAPIKPSEPGKASKFGANVLSLLTGNRWGRGRTRVKQNYQINSNRFQKAQTLYNSPEQQKIRNNYAKYMQRYTKKKQPSNTRAGNKNMTNLDYLSSVLNLNLGPNTASGPVTTQQQYGTGPNTLTVTSTEF